MSNLVGKYFEKLLMLRPKQIPKLGVVEWLISNQDDDRGSGRTFLLALAYIKTALQNPDKWIPLHDHFGYRQDLIGNVIHSILSEAGRFGWHVGQLGLCIQSEWAFPTNAQARIREQTMALELAMLENALQDVKLSAKTAIHFGVDAEKVLDTVREAIVENVLEGK